MKKGIPILIVVLLLLITPTGSIATFDRYQQSVSMGNTLYVGGSGPGNYTRIQDAIDNASYGDTVFVYSGVYNENLILDYFINLIGEDRDNTIINGNGIGKVIILSSNNVIKNFTIQNSGNGSFDTGICGGNDNLITNNIIRFNRNGISFDGNRNTIIENDIFENENYGIELRHSFHNQIIRNSISSNRESGIYFTMESSENIISQNVIYLNDCGILFDHCRENTISVNKIVKNTGNDIHIINGNKNITITNNLINSNTGIAIYVAENNKNITITNNTISNCYGGIYHITTNNSIIFGNNITNSSRGIVLANSSSISVYKNEIKNSYQGAVIHRSSYCNIQHNNFIKNKFGLEINSCNKVKIEFNNYENNTLAFDAVLSDNVTVTKNNFINNLFNGRFHNPCNFNNNYWNKKRIFPKIIFGKINYPFQSNPLGYEYIPWICIDWHPATEPYDIG